MVHNEKKYLGYLAIDNTDAYFIENIMVSWNMLDVKNNKVKI